MDPKNESVAMPFGHPSRRAHLTGDAAIIENQKAIIAALKNDVLEARARHAADMAVVEAAANEAGGGRALAEYRLKKVADIALDLVGELFRVDGDVNTIIRDLQKPSSEYPEGLGEMP